MVKGGESTEAQGSRLSPGRLLSTILTYTNMSALACDFAISSPHFTSHLTLDCIEMTITFVFFFSVPHHVCLSSCILFDTKIRCISSWCCQQKAKQKLNHISSKVFPAPSTTRITTFFLYSSLCFKGVADVPPTKISEVLLGPFRMTAWVVLLEKQPFLIKHGFQIEGVNRKRLQMVVISGSC